MKKIDFLCSFCGNECTIETFGVDDEVQYCPICGESQEEEPGDFDPEWE